MTEHSPLLWQVARAAGLSSGDAEDVLQTVWMRLLAHLDDIRTSAALTGWLVVTARREAWRVRAAGRRQVPAERRVPSTTLPDRSAGPQEQVIIDDQRRTLWVAIGQLPARCQELLRIIAFVPRPDYAAVAAELGMPVGSVGPPAAGAWPSSASCWAWTSRGALMTTSLGPRPSADAPLDDLDLALLDDIREMFQAADPMPADLPERIRFLLALRDLEIEVARLAASEELLVRAVRGAEQSRTITFDSDSLTIMIRIDANGDGTVRVDGWLAPPQRREIEMKTTPRIALSAAATSRGASPSPGCRGEPPSSWSGRRAGQNGAPVGGNAGARPVTAVWEAADRMPRAEALAPALARPGGAAGPRGARARPAGRQRGRPAVGARYVRAGLRQLGWAEDGGQPDARQVATRRITPWPPGC